MLTITLSIAACTDALFSYVPVSFQEHKITFACTLAVLLIVRALSEGQLRAYLALCRELGLDALVETHDEDELAVALAAGARVVGINNRNLDTMEVSLETTERLRSIRDELLSITGGNTGGNSGG